MVLSRDGAELYLTGQNEHVGGQAGTDRSENRTKPLHLLLHVMLRKCDYETGTAEGV